MVINIRVQHNGGVLPDIILLTQGYSHRETCLICHVEFLSPQPMKQYIIATMVNDVRHCLCFVFVWCPCMAINISVQYNSGLLPDIIRLTQCYYHRGTGLKCHEEVLYLQSMILPKRFDIFPPDRGMLRRSRRVQIFH